MGLYGYISRYTRGDLSRTSNQSRLLVVEDKGHVMWGLLAPSVVMLIAFNGDRIGSSLIRLYRILWRD